MNNIPNPQFMFPYGINLNTEDITNYLKTYLNKQVTIFLNMDSIIKAFKGSLINVGSDYLIIKDTTNETKFLIQTKNISYITLE